MRRRKSPLKLISGGVLLASVLCIYPEQYTVSSVRRISYDAQYFLGAEERVSARESSEVAERKRGRESLPPIRYYDTINMTNGACVQTKADKP